MTLALVLGSADCLFDDIEDFYRLGHADVVAACNDAIPMWTGHLSAACSLHQNKLSGWLKQRQENGLELPDYAYAFEGRSWDVTPYKFEGQEATGSSGLYALKVALCDLGATHAVLCGIPMDQRGHFFNPASWRGHRSHRKGWEQALPAIKDRARSMSGWTAELLGKPDAAWMKTNGGKSGN